MEITKTALNNEIKAIVDAKTTKDRYQLVTYIRCNGKDSKMMQTVSLDVVRAYANSYADTVVVDLAMGLGDFTYDIYPYKDALEVTIYFIPAGLSTVGSVLNRAYKKMQFTGILLGGGSSQMESKNIVNNDRFTMNIAGLKHFKMQLIDPTTEWVRMEQVGGNFKDCVPADLIQYLLTQQSKRVKLSANNTIKGVDIVTPDNKNARATLVIPHGTLLTSVPQMISDKAGGVYSTGFGYYLQDGTWYLYPLYNLQRFAKTPKTLTVINVPPDKMPGIEQTYRLAGQQLIVISTGKSKHLDKSDGAVANSGNGIRYVEAKNVIEGNVKVEGNKMTMDRRKANSEFKTESQYTGLNNAPMAQSRVVGNGFKEMAKLAAKQGTLFMAEWENANPDALYPGMPVKVIYSDGDKVRTTFGVLHAVHSFYHMLGDGMLAQRHGCTSVLGIFVEKAFKV